MWFNWNTLLCSSHYQFICDIRKFPQRRKFSIRSAVLCFFRAGICAMGSYENFLIFATFLLRNALFHRLFLCGEMFVSVWCENPAIYALS